MGSPFTDEEKRFLLAEMIKVSRLDIETLGNFIRTHGIEPNWMHMQLPLGRNMTQSMQAAENIGIGQRSWLKRRMSDDLSDSAAKRLALPGNIDSSAPSAAPTHVAILPRPSSSSAEIAPTSAPTPTPAPTPSSTAPKKKGRPARADKARFRPILPQHIAPRPVEQNQRNSLHNQPDQSPQPSQQGQNTRGHSIPRTIIPPASYNAESAVNFQAAGNYSTSYARPLGGRTNPERGGTPQNETLPRVIAEPAHEQYEAPRHNSIPGPVPLEPDPRASNSVPGGHNELTTLPPLLERDGTVALMGSPRVDNHAPVTNAA